MNQLSIPYQARSETSRAAAESIAEGASTLRAKVLAYLRDHPDGLTDEQMQGGLGMNPSTQRPRRGELLRMGLVVDSGKQRATKSGRMAVVWISIRE